MSNPAAQLIRRVAVIGTGVVGASWAAYFLANGLDVAASDPAPGAEDYLGRFIERARPDLARLGLTGNGNLSFHRQAEEAAAEAGFIQENAPEREDLKRDLLARLDRTASPDAIIASSTSSLLRSAMVQDCATPERIIVAHPFNPPHLVPLVELVGEPDATRRTSTAPSASARSCSSAKRSAISPTA
jgi:carnitine 3-dehydrogenase